MKELTIRPLGDQIIIRTIPVGSVGSILLPDSAQNITLIGSGGQTAEQEATDYMIGARLFEELLNALKEHPRAASEKKQFRWRQDLAAKLERAKTMPVRSNPDYKNATHFVEAEVIAVGPGDRTKEGLAEELAAALAYYVTPPYDDPEPFSNDSIQIRERNRALIDRARNHSVVRKPLLVQRGDRVLFHPSVQRFDRDITDRLHTPDDGDCRYFITKEHSILAKVDLDEVAA